MKKKTNNTFYIKKLGWIVIAFLVALTVLTLIFPKEADAKSIMADSEAAIAQEYVIDDPSFWETLWGSSWGDLLWFLRFPNF